MVVVTIRREMEGEQSNEEIDEDDEIDRCRDTVSVTKNAIYSKRNYYKSKREFEALRVKSYDMRAENDELKAENKRLEALVQEALRLVSLQPVPVSAPHFSSALQPQLYPAPILGATSGALLPVPHYFPLEPCVSSLPTLGASPATVASGTRGYSASAAPGVALQKEDADYDSDSRGSLTKNAWYSRRSYYKAEIRIIFYETRLV